VILPFGDAHARAYQEKIDLVVSKFLIPATLSRVTRHLRSSRAPNELSCSQLAARECAFVKLLIESALNEFTKCTTVGETFLTPRLLNKEKKFFREENKKPLIVFMMFCMQGVRTKLFLR
jgi:hypothetical protein